MSLADELQKLEQLHRHGTLTDDEFTQAKATLLANPVSADADVGQHLSEQLAEVRLQNDLTRIDREWDIERQKYLISSRYGRPMIPTVPMGIGTVVVGGGFGIFWTIMAISITGSAPDEMPFSLVKLFFPIFGLFFIGMAIWWGVSCCTKAKQYDDAFRAYQSRRNTIARGNAPAE